MNSKVTGIAYEVDYQHAGGVLRRAAFVRENVDFGHHHDL
jgi:hypothetical protein